MSNDDIKTLYAVILMILALLLLVISPAIAIAAWRVLV